MAAAGPRVVVLGAGISGLATAEAVLRMLPSVQRLTVLEQRPRTGGCIYTHPDPASCAISSSPTTRTSLSSTSSASSASTPSSSSPPTPEFASALVLEQGPRGLRPVGVPGRATLDLVHRLGLSDDVIAAAKDAPGAANRYIFTGSHLEKLPTGPLDFVRHALASPSDPSSPGFATAALGRALLREPFIPDTASKKSEKADSTDPEDESIQAFVERRLGRTVADYLIGSLCVGIFGGRAETLSLRACFPMLADMQQLGNGSLLRGALRYRADPAPPPLPGSEALLDKVKGARLWSLRHGLGQLAAALEAHLSCTDSVTLQKNCAVDSLTASSAASSSAPLAVQLADGGAVEADYVVSALPAWRLAGVVEGADPRLAAGLRTIPHLGIATVNLVYPRHVLPVAGFGHLIPPSANDSVLGVVYDSCAMPQQDADVAGPVTRLTVMMGGWQYAALFGSHDAEPPKDQLLSMALDAVARHLGIEDPPAVANVYAWPRCMPQYTVGHLQRLAGIDAALAAGPFAGRLFYTGNSFRGVGVNDCVLNAGRVVRDQLLPRVGSSQVKG